MKSNGALDLESDPIKRVILQHEQRLEKLEFANHILAVGLPIGLTLLGLIFAVLVMHP
jgi:hypothetical protein